MVRDVVHLIHFFLAAFLSCSAEARSWYVDSQATDRQDGQSPSTAWRTLGSIKQSLLCPGDVVFVQAGTYDERLILKRGGDPSSRITYKGVHNPVIRGIEGAAIDDVAVIGFEIFQGSSSYRYPGIKLSGAKGWLIQDNYIHGIGGASGGVVEAYNTVNSFNIIRANHFEDMGLVPGSKTLGISVIIRGDHNLVEYNVFGRGDDRTNIFGSFNIIRNNYMGPMLEADIPGVDPHIDDMQSYNSTGPQFDTNLFERNFSDQNDSDNAHCFFIRNVSGGRLRHLISRLNISSGNGSFISQLENIDAAWVYNNTFVDAQNRALEGRKRSYAVSINGTVGGFTYWRNNSFVRAAGEGEGKVFLVTQKATLNEDYNHSYLSGRLFGRHDIVNADPRFAGERPKDFTLSAHSPLRGSAGPIALATNDGNLSTRLVADNADGFCDGWGIVEGDQIAIGAGDYVRILGIDYGEKIISLGEMRSWRAHDPIFVRGTSDIGALPYGTSEGMMVNNTTSVPRRAGAWKLSAIVVGIQSVRWVEFLVDGIPVGSASAEPYSVEWESDGAPHVVTARAYSLWASMTPFVESSVWSTPAG
jgi:hypothetical protein